MKPAIASRVYLNGGRAYCVCSECGDTLFKNSLITFKGPYTIDGPLEHDELTGMPCQIRELVESIDHDGTRARAKSAFSIFGTDRS